VLPSFRLHFPLKSTLKKNVLILYSFSPRETFTQLEPLKAAARRRYPGPILFYVEYLESLRFSEAGYRQALAATTIQSYRGRQIDLIVAVVYPALQFALDYRDNYAVLHVKDELSRLHHPQAV
jgi:hypothetical protein